MSDIKFPLRIGKAQKRALLDATGQEIALFNKKYTDFASEVCIYLNDYSDYFTTDNHRLRITIFPHSKEIGISLIEDTEELILSKEEAVELAKELIDFIKTV